MNSIANSLELSVSGGAFERGRGQGMALALEIRRHASALYEVWKSLGIDNPKQYLNEFLSYSDYLTAMGLYASEVVDEIRGMASGSGLEFNEVYVLQLMDEEWAYRRQQLHARRAEKCSSAAIWDLERGVTFVGQNMDLGVYTDGFQRLVHHAPGKGIPETMLFTLAGMVALMGTNSAGVGICVNALPQLPSANVGVPVAVVIRLLLCTSSASEAVEVLHSIPHATGQHYLIADPEGLHSYEASPAGVYEYRSPWPDRTFHTNHPLNSRLAAATGWSSAKNSQMRLKSMVSRLSGSPGSMADIAAALSARDDPQDPVCRPRIDSNGPTSAMTCGSFISALHRGGAVHGVSTFGPPSELDYREWRLV
jgi:isopenicillin-N N-acyltransferase-like protein